MPLTDSQLRHYDSSVLRLPDDKRKDYHRQVDWLVSSLSRELQANTSVKITKVVKAGSFAKFTILRKTNDDPVDVDVVFFLSDRSVQHETLSTLNDTIQQLLVGIYPNKEVGDFKIQRKATTVSFLSTGLSVDVVPVIADRVRSDYGWQFNSDGTVTQTCPSAHVQFVRDRKAKDKDFRTLVRLAKRWRNHAGLNPLKSFAIELILGHLVDNGNLAGTLERRFEHFLLYIAQSGLRKAITFPENGTSASSFLAPVVIVDPASDKNNVTARITEVERQSIVAMAKESWEAAHFASIEDESDLWKDVFGPRFATGG